MRAVLSAAVIFAAAVFYLFALPAGRYGEQFVEIAPGTSTPRIAEELAKAGVIRWAPAFEAIRLIRGGTLQAGEYRFDHPARVGQVYDRLARGDVFTVTLAVPEGSNLFDIAGRVEAAGLGTRAGFLMEARRSVGLVRDLDPGAPSLEGYLYPVTYRFGRNVTARQILSTMVHRFRQEAVTLGITGDVHVIVTLASLVERETPIAGERALVAGVFENRLARGMRLETDPTVIYAALLDGRYSGVISRADLAAASAYNTYQHAGLPPGPICNPGAVSLAAAAKPAHTDYLYFVAAGSDPQGRSRFSSTYDEHERNVQAYRKSLATHP